MTTTRQQVLGWIEHCEREHAGRGTNVPVWLFSMDAVQEAVRDGDVQQIGTASFIPRWGMSFIEYGLTDQGRQKFYAALPVAGQPNL